MCVRPTPEWQKGIATFMKKLPDQDVEADGENEPVVEVTGEVTGAESATRSLIRCLLVLLFLCLRHRFSTVAEAYCFWV